MIAFVCRIELEFGSISSVSIYNEIATTVTTIVVLRVMISLKRLEGSCSPLVTAEGHLCPEVD